MAVADDIIFTLSDLEMEDWVVKETAPQGLSASSSLFYMLLPFLSFDLFPLK